MIAPLRGALDALKRVSPAGGAIAVGIAPAFWVVGYLAGGRHGFDWNAAAAAATAYGTFALALVTRRLVVFTSDETSATLQLARLAEQDQWDRTRSAERTKVERVVAAVQEVADAAIVAQDNNPARLSP
jgi:hypothetical protein